MNSNDEFYTPEEIAEYLKTTTKHVRTLTKTQNLPFYRVGAKIMRFRIEEVKEWVEAQAQKPLEQ